MSSDMVTKAMAQVNNGLGVLLGTGRISATTHEEIMSLLNADPGYNTGAFVGPMQPTFTGSSNMVPAQAKRPEGREVIPAFPRPRKETPVSIQSHDLLGLGTDADSEAARPPQSNRGQISPVIPPKEGHKLICPWWSTEGYTCREHDLNECPFWHDNIAGGIKHPLICHFWSDGRCTKSDQECRFAHYKAPHGVVAPQPSKKKSKKQRSAAGDDTSHAGNTTSRHNNGPDDDYWRRRLRAPQEPEW
ncbi:hypothetical protein F5B19DRAFT_495035 [Rostrohypoxylon terebratum]|nr:hypothetical protein F5B19DRAFT_495035 [Rostrohypoxylon terebratum]